MEDDEWVLAFIEAWQLLDPRLRQEDLVDFAQSLLRKSRWRSLSPTAAASAAFVLGKADED